MQARNLNATEAVLFRTRNEFVTDQRIIINGNSYPLTDIETVRVAATQFFYVVQLVRLVAGVAIGLLVLRWLGVLPLAIVPDNELIHLIETGLLTALAFVMPDLVATHTLVLETPTRRARFMPSSDAERLERLAAKATEAIMQARARRHHPDEPQVILAFRRTLKS